MHGLTRRLPRLNLPPNQHENSAVSSSHPVRLPLPGPFLLPDRIGEGDYIEIGNIGAYGRVMASHFNGCGYYDEVIVQDEPMLSMYTEGQEAPVISAVRC